MVKRNVRLALLAVVVSALAAPWAARAQDPPDKPIDRTFNMGAAWELTPESKKAVEKGLAWLAGRQQEDGSFGSQGGYSKHAGITGLCGLAFLAGGNVPGRGPYGQNAERAMEFVLACTNDSNGLIAGQEVSSGPMYGHGFATLFLAEIYGMTGNEQVREKLRLAVKLIVNTQNKQGGWRYMPIPQDADMSVTICQTMALRAARNAGIKVPKKTVDKAIEYVRKSHASDGGFSYTYGGGGSTFPCTAAAVASLYYTGVYSGKELDDGIRYMLRQKSAFTTAGGGGFGHFFYGNYYSAQAFFLAGGQHWKDWFTALRDCLVKMQNKDGNWVDGVGPEFATAMALIILQVPNRYLPILEK